MFRSVAGGGCSEDKAWRNKVYRGENNGRDEYIATPSAPYFFTKNDFIYIGV